MLTAFQGSPNIYEDIHTYEKSTDSVTILLSMSSELNFEDISWSYYHQYMKPPSIYYRRIAYILPDTMMGFHSGVWMIQKDYYSECVDVLHDITSKFRCKGKGVETSVRVSYGRVCR